MGAPVLSTFDSPHLSPAFASGCHAPPGSSHTVPRSLRTQQQQPAAALPGHNQAQARLGGSDLNLLELAGGTRTPNLLFARQQRIVHGVLAGAVLAGQVSWAVQRVPSRRAE